MSAPPLVLPPLLWWSRSLAEQRRADVDFTPGVIVEDHTTGQPWYWDVQDGNCAILRDLPSDARRLVVDPPPPQADGRTVTATFRLDGPGGRRIAIPPVWPGETHVRVWGHAVTSTTCTQLDPGQARALAAHLMHCADAIDPPPAPADRPIPYLPTGA